ncbi:MAG TPA: ferrochelatase [Casimicrobiaceae bacterium]|nr:ferrochelatase [Casimicrobiaceae bacterium]
MAHAPESNFAHDRVPRVGVLLVNLGTPDAPTPSAVRRYLAQFLSDPRVIEIPRWLWTPILYSVILLVRPSKSAGKYAAIWTTDGSPLLVHSQKQKSLLLGYLGQRLKAAGYAADACPVELGMRYGNPSVGSAIDRLRAANCERILIVPMYPQYAASTTAATLDAVADHLRHVRRVPGLRMIDTFHADSGYIKAMAQNVNDYWVKNGRPERLVLSFHGLPKQTLDRGDPYHCLCHVTARLLAQELGLAPSQWTLTFQSRFGKAPWLKPYTSLTLQALGREGVRRVDVFCPGFVADCLETLEEIGIEARATFLDSGGKEFHVIPCLNEHPLWIKALADLVFRNLDGWVDVAPDAQTREATLLRARALGARS